MQHANLTAELHEDFPLARYMQVEVAAWDHHSLTLAAPLAPNLNHADTAFGGAISTLGILSGYTLLHLALIDRNISTRILIQQSTTNYTRPIDSPFSATASLPDPAALDAFLIPLQKKRRARISIPSTLLCAQSPAATHAGLYVVILY